MTAEGTPPAFVSETIEPEIGGMDPARLASGEPDVPRAFSWRGRRYETAEVLRTWKTYHVDRGDRYVDKHWFEVRTAGGATMRLYCKRRERTTARWVLFSVACETSSQP